MALTKKTGYGLIAMTRLAGLAEGRLASAREIAEQFGVPQSLLMNVLKDLASAGYVESVRGAHGGYRLAKPAEEISLGGVITAVEGPVRLAECVRDETGDDEECTCQVMAACPIADPVHRVHRRLNDFLNKVTLAELIDPSLTVARSQT